MFFLWPLPINFHFQSPKWKQGRESNPQSLGYEPSMVFQFHYPASILSFGSENGNRTHIKTSWESCAYRYTISPYKKTPKSFRRSGSLILYNSILKDKLPRSNIHLLGHFNLYCDCLCWKHNPFPVFFYSFLTIVKGFALETLRIW